MYVTKHCPACYGLDLERIDATQGIESWMIEYLYDWPEVKTESGWTVPRIIPNLVRCKRCELIYVDVRYSPEEMGQIYGEYSTRRMEIRKKYFPEASGWANAEVATRARKQEFTKIVQTATAVNNGIILRSYLDYGGDCSYTEPHQFDQMYCFNPGNHDPAPLHAVRLTTNAQLQSAAPYSLISLAHVLEHLPDPISLLWDLHRYADENTIFHFEVPLQIGGDPRGQSSLELRPGKLSEHINYFNFRSLFYILSRSGYRIANMWMCTPDSGGTQTPVYIVAICKSVLQMNAKSAEFNGTMAPFA